MSHEIFSLRKKPKWPTFRGAMLDAETLTKLDKVLGENAHTVYYAHGSYLNREGPNGGCYGSIKAMRPMVSFEQRQWVLHEESGKRKPLYLLGWIGEYGNGSIMHVSWQYPHCCEYNKDSLAAAAFVFYEHIARTLYSVGACAGKMDKEVADFLKNARAKIKANG